MLAARGDKTTLPAGCVTLSGDVLDADGTRVKTIDYRGPDSAEGAGIFANLGRINARGRCRIAIDYANTSGADVPIHLVVTKVK